MTATKLAEMQLKKKEYEKEIKILEEQIKIEEMQSVKETIVHRIAILLHDNTCTSSHTDQCSWLYEIKGTDEHNKPLRDWKGHAHNYYFEKALKLVNALNVKITNDLIVADMYNQKILEIAEIVLKNLK